MVPAVVVGTGAKWRQRGSFHATILLTTTQQLPIFPRIKYKVFTITHTSLLTMP